MNDTTFAVVAVMNDKSAARLVRGAMGCEEAHEFADSLRVIPGRESFHITPEISEFQYNGRFAVWSLVTETGTRFYASWVSREEAEEQITKIKESGRESICCLVIDLAASATQTAALN